MSAIGINFRGSSGYVTDPAGTTYCLGTTGGDAYPTTRGGFTFGWDADGSGKPAQGTDRNSGNDPRLAGINFSGISGFNPFRLDIGADTYNVSLAIGDASGGTSQTIITVKDAGGTLFTVTQVSTTANSFTDALGNEYTAANWPASNQPQSATVTGTYIRFEVTGVGGAAFGGLAHFAVAAAGGAGPVIPVFMNQYRQRWN